MLAVMLAMLVQPHACTAIASDWIRGSDLANAIPAFNALQPDLKISPSPLPGQTRIFRSAELRRLAIANHLSATTAGEICFSWSMKPIIPESLEAAMRLTLAGRDPQINILDWSLIPVPDGTIVFPFTGLGAAGVSGAIWRGYVSYAANQRFPIWAHVRLAITEKRVVAVNALHFGKALQAEDLRVEAYTGPIPREEPFTELSQVLGMIARRDIPAATPVCSSMLETPREILRGDTVSVIARSGAATIEAQGVAEQDGRRGDVITLRNPRSGKTFRGRVQKKDVVAVVPGGFFGLVAEGKS